MKIKAAILSFLILLTSSGIALDINICCDSFAGFSLHYTPTKTSLKEDCCACVKASKSTCCHTNPVFLPKNDNLGYQKLTPLSFANNFTKMVYTQFSLLPEYSIQNLNYLNTHFISIVNKRAHAVPILIDKCVFQI